MSKGPKRNFIFSDEIDAESVRWVMQAITDINYYDEEQERNVVGYERQPIALTINSYGGVVTDAFALIGVMENSKTEIHTYALGQIASAAVPIFVAGTKRFINRLARVMYHDCLYSTYFVSTTTHEETLEENKRIRDVMDEYLLERTNMSREVMDKAKKEKRNLWFTAQEAIDAGIAHEMMTRHVKEVKEEDIA